ncbi:unnamed protein product, partial [Rotaria sordida]
TKPSIAEYIVTIYLASSALDTIREICTNSSPRFIRRLTVRKIFKKKMITNKTNHFVMYVN